MIFTVCTAGPDHSSVADPLGDPPAANAAALLPIAAKLPLAIFKSFTSVQAVPFQDSVFAKTVGGLVPPTHKAKVCDPTLLPISPLLAVFTLLTIVQLVPFQLSV